MLKGKYRGILALCIILILLLQGCTESQKVTETSPETKKITSEDINKAKQVIRDYKVALYEVADYVKTFESFDLTGDFTKSHAKFMEQFRPFFSKAGYEDVLSKRDVVSYRWAATQAGHNLHFRDLTFFDTQERGENITIGYQASFTEINPKTKQENIVTEKGSTELQKEEGQWKIVSDKIHSAKVGGETELPLPVKMIVGKDKQSVEVKETLDRTEILGLVNQMFGNRNYYKRFGQYGCAVVNGSIDNHKQNSWIELVYDKPVEVNFYQSNLIKTYKIFIDIDDERPMVLIAPGKNGKYVSGSAPLEYVLDSDKKIDELLAKH